MQPGATVTMALNSEAAAHAVATLAEATLQGGGQIVLAETAAAVGALAGVQDATGLVQIPVSMYQTVVTSLAQGNRPVQVAMAPVATRIDNTVTLDGQAGGGCDPGAVTITTLEGVEGTEWPPWRFVYPTVFQDITLCTMSNIFFNVHLQGK
ncbi:Nuclear respiratory factor 1 [Larimichthys crocea]|uniref:Uncharacterized protein n=1 Tax=Larimichthys crocea TaxID=215358 RepID=A0ACD3Q6Y8_LARCR|nr:Nuclear respiratory factor 1 [Larimichthys crocea]